MSDEWNSREPSPLHMLGMVSSETARPRCVAPFWQNIIDVAAVPEDTKVGATKVLTEDIVFPQRDFHLILAGTEVNRLFLWSWPGIVEVVALDDVQRKALHDMSLPAVPGIPPGKVLVLPAPGSSVPTAAFDLTDPAFTSCVRALMTEHAERPIPLEWNGFPVFTKWWHTT
ncbi:hypothetical protein SAMN04489726_0812 [Allokutzneria albata]|uniref:Uncharacterized protein n=2 Tax=Allokutzneria albata TaxID=211114 RepID=A0A1G9S0E0_ALLAB|nr:hypothetical protein SAMN04489726_0812 [Allokutzneria albata]